MQAFNWTGNPAEQSLLDASTYAYTGSAYERSVLLCVVYKQVDAPGFGALKYADVYKYISETLGLPSILESNAMGLGASSAGLDTALVA